MIILAPGQAYYGEFTTCNPLTGVAQNADSLPTITANKNGTDDAGFVLTAANIDTGRYKVTGTVPITYADKDTVRITAAATVVSVSGKEVIDTIYVYPDLAQQSTVAKETTVQSIKDTLVIASGAINDAAPSKTKFITTLTGYGLDYWDNMAIRWTSGPNSGLIRALKAYKNDGELTMNTALPNTPTNGDAFDVIMLRAFRLAGISQQEVADSLQLAPAGVAADGSVGEQLAQIVGFLEGEGNRSVTMQFYITGTTTPIPNVEATVMNGLDNVFLTHKTADANGQATMARNDGTYKVRASCVGYSFTNPLTLTVSGSGTYILYGDGVPMPVAPAANMQNLTGSVVRLNWALATGDIVKARIASDGKKVNSALVQNIILPATVDANGQFLLVVPCNCAIIVEVPHHGEHRIETNSTNGTVDISTYIP